MLVVGVWAGGSKQVVVGGRWWVCGRAACRVVGGQPPWPEQRDGPVASLHTPSALSR